MNLRLSSLRAMFIHQGNGRLSATAAVAAVAAVTFALAGVGMSSALAAPGAAASAPDAASVSYANGGQLTVKPGQSLNDVAIAVTQSHDRATLARASRALFDANPNAFMSHDPSRMRLGAVLTVPALDASGVLAASAAAVTATVSGASASSSASAASASAPVGTIAATTATGAAAATGAASAVAQVNAAAASAASAAARAAAPATPAVPGTASAVTTAGSATPGSGTTTAGGAVASAPVAGSQTASPASGAHEWSGSIQPSASESAAGASASAAGSAATAAQAASQPRAQVSSLQQLLALKNRVLMELQKHGIGGSPAATRAASTGAAVPVGASSATTAASATAAASGHGGAVTSVSNDGGISQVGLSIAAAVGAALVVLLAALRMRRRKRDANATAEVSAADGDAVASAQANDPHDVASAREQASVRDTSDDSADVSVSHAAALAAAEHEAAEGAAAAREQAEREAAEREAEIRQAAAREAEHKAAESAAAERAAEEHAESERVAKEQADAERAAAEQVAAEEREASERTAAERAASEQAAAERAAAEHENFASATTAASLAAAAELGAEALPLTPLEPVDESFQHEPPAHRLQWDDEPAPSAPAASQTASAELQSALNVPPPAIDFTQPAESRDMPTPFGQPYADASAHPLPDTTLPPVPLTHLDPAHDEATYQPSYELHQPTQAAMPDGASTVSEPTPLSQAQHTLTAPTEFPRDAVDAFSALDMPLPPRIESPFEGLHAPASLTTQPVASPETTAQQALAPHDPDDVPHIADEITAGTAGHAAVAGLGATGFGAMGGLGAAGFGALKLDFDLELPPSPAQPLPAFTPADLTRIARNKLDLAAEYIDLGDLSGARSLINEVIEANDPATRTEARALLSTLAPLS